MHFRTILAIGFTSMLLAGAACADIQHVVIFKYKDGVSEQEKSEIAKRFVALKDLAKRDGKTYIVAIKGGKAISKEGLDQGLEEGFIVTFKNEDDRNYFVGKPYSETMDPDHRALAGVVVPFLSHDSNGQVNGIFAFDFDDAAR